jgi:hypothetical protein
MMMITRNDWDAALDAWVIEERERLGGPPTPEEIIAWKRGDLDEEEAARVRALLVYYPELSSLITEPLEAQAVVRPFPWKNAFAVAASIFIAVIAMLLVRERRENATPKVYTARYEFTDVQTRGATTPATYVLPANQKHYLVTAVLAEPPSDHPYRIVITRDGQPVWNTNEAHPIDGAFEIDLPGNLLKPGTYILEVYEGARLANRYRFRVGS